MKKTSSPPSTNIRLFEKNEFNRLSYSIKAGENTGIFIKNYNIASLDEIYNVKTKKILTFLIVTIGIEQKTLAEKVFDITPNTLRSYRREKNKELSPRLKELALSIQNLYSKGKELFLTHDSFNLWLNKNQMGLEDRKPIEFINTIAGIQMVTEELLRIEYGATA